MTKKWLDSVKNKVRVFICQMMVFGIINKDVALPKPWASGPFHGCVFQLFIKSSKRVSINKAGKWLFIREKKAKG